MKIMYSIGAGDTKVYDVPSSVNSLGDMKRELDLESFSCSDENGDSVSNDDALESGKEYIFTERSKAGK